MNTVVYINLFSTGDYDSDSDSDSNTVADMRVHWVVRGMESEMILISASNGSGWLAAVFRLDKVGLNFRAPR